ncbi:MAG TPA: pyrroline-5-carboxylate reductase [Chloroflexi bacterium]|nr:pyrroline-5-carboxylate reductase [Chloroflexota bacterium]
MNATERDIEILRGKRIALIGCGVMGEAIAATLLRGELVTTDQLVGAEPYEERRQLLAERYGIRMVTDNAEAAEGADIVMLTIKPQSLGKVGDDLRGRLGRDQVVVSIMAGATVDRLHAALGHERLVRSMPNTPAQIGQGVTVWLATPSVTDEQAQAVAALLGAMGEAVRVESEEMVDMATALSGTGPAYVFLVMEALIDAGVHMGFPRRIAEELVLQTMQGSVQFARESGLHPAEQCGALCPPFLRLLLGRDIPKDQHGTAHDAVG